MQAIMRAYRKWRFCNKLHKIFDFLRELDNEMKRAGIKRPERRRMWKNIKENMTELQKIASKMEV